jgi:hypothetical protein
VAVRPTGHTLGGMTWDTIEKLMGNLQTMLTFDASHEHPSTTLIAHQPTVETQADKWVENWVHEHRVPPGMSEPLRCNLYARVSFAREQAASSLATDRTPPKGAAATATLRNLLVTSWHESNRAKWLESSRSARAGEE